MKRIFVLLSPIVPVLVATSCKEPTQIVVEARTNVAFKPGIVTAFTVGGPGQTEKAEPTTETGEPWNGSVIGTLVVVPGSADDATLAVKLVMGVTRGARECVAPDYRGCIVARRRLRYAPNELLRLPITLYAECQDVPCDELSTCSVLGKCVPIEPECRDATCTLPGEIAEDGGIVAAPIDAAKEDGETSTGGDASLDASTDANADADAGKALGFKCTGAPGNECSLPNRCCAPADTDQGSCITDKMACPTTHALVTCDGQEDCGGRFCCVSEGPGSVMSCSGTPCPATSNEVCESDGVCKGGGTCSGSAYGYRVCQ